MDGYKIWMKDRPDIFVEDLSRTIMIERKNLSAYEQYQSSRALTELDAAWNRTSSDRKSNTLTSSTTKTPAKASAKQAFITPVVPPPEIESVRLNQTTTKIVYEVEKSKPWWKKIFLPLSM